MDSNEIPVLTKKVQLVSAETQATTPNPAASTSADIDVAALTATIKQSVLAELSAQWSEDIAKQVSAQVQQALTSHAESERQALSEYVQQVRASLEADVGKSVAAAVTSLEHTFRDSLQQIANQQLQSMESQFYEMWQNQQSSLTEKAYALQNELLSALNAQALQLQSQSKQILGETFDASTADLTQEYVQNLRAAFATLADKETEAFKSRFSEAIPGIESGLDAKVDTLIKVHMAEIEKQLVSQLKNRILEVLQGIRFVMPSV